MIRGELIAPLKFSRYAFISCCRSAIRGVPGIEQSYCQNNGLYFFQLPGMFIAKLLNIPGSLDHQRDIFDG